MTEKDSVLVLGEGKESIAFPGSGGYKIELSPGTKLLPMNHALSGHLLLECDYDEDLQANSTNAEELSFLTDLCHLTRQHGEAMALSCLVTQVGQTTLPNHRQRTMREQCLMCMDT